MISLEILREANIDAVRAIHRDDIPESWVDNADTLWELTQYGLDHECIGHTYAVKYGDSYIGVILLGEAIPWETDPEEMNGVPFYRLMGFVIDNRYRSQGIGGYVLEQVIHTIYDEYGVRPIALGVHQDNTGAARFYEKHGFRKTDAMEGKDIYYLRYPQHFIAERGRIGLIPYTHEDDEDMLACWQDRDTQKGYNHAFQGSLKDLRGIDISSFPFWVVAVDRTSGAKIGILRLGKGEMPDLAIWIYPQYRGMGYGAEAFSLAADHIFCSMNLRKIYAGCYYDNHASMRMLEKAGFRRYPAGDRQENNCFTCESTTQLSFVKDKVLETKDLLLRQGYADDWKDLYRNLWSRVEVFRFMFKNPCPSEEHAVARTGAYAVMHEEVNTEFFACEKTSGQAIGIAGVKELNPGKWTITDIAIGPDFQGKGYGKQIVTALLNLAFELGATEVAYDCFTQNTASKQLALSCGFTYSHSEEAELMKNDEKVILDYFIIKK